MWDVIIAGVVGTALGGAIAGYVVLVAQRRHDLKAAGILETIAARRISTDAACREFEGIQAEVSHCVAHLHDGDDYRERLNDQLQRMRDLSRKEVGVLGEDVSNLARRFTDSMRRELESPQGLSMRGAYDYGDEETTSLRRALNLVLRGLESPPYLQ